MRVLGIDPGSRVTGFGVVNLLSSGRLEYVASGCVRVPAGELAERLRVIYEGVGEVVASYRPGSVAVERVFLARNADSALKLGQARASAILAAANHGLALAEYSALQIKQALVGRGHAEKHQVKHMVRALLGLSGAPQDDAADALACAICHAHHLAAGRSGLRPAARRRTSRRSGLRLPA